MAMARDRAGRSVDVERGWTRGVDQMHAAVYPFSFELMEPVGDGPLYTFPFFDTRLVDWAVGVPSAPWFIDKEVIRAALRGRVPEEVRLRPKTPLVDEPRFALRREHRRALETILDVEEVRSWIDVDACREALRSDAMSLGGALPYVRAAAAARLVAELAIFGGPSDTRQRPWEQP
jgi:hypothetical protein